ncbi:hypothetical protein N2152v2_001605 [Parachlorella kessleri]
MRHCTPLLLAAALLATAVLQSGQAAASPLDADLLLGWKGSLENNDTVLHSWVPGTAPCDDPQWWEGIMCIDGNVTALLVGSMGLLGALPTSPLPPSLANLHLYNNSLSGSLDLASVPDGIQAVNLAGNALNGSIPAEMSLPDSLLQLSLSGNALTGTIPATLQLPANLQYLFLANNSLSGELPTYLQLPPTLLGLDLFNNRLSGGIPPNLTEWLPEGLYYLDLHGNSLTGPLPPLNNTNANIYVQPGNSFCGQVGSPGYYVYNPVGQSTDVTDLPPC